MGLIVSVYRTNGPDCTNGGISATVDHLTVVNVEGPFEPTETRPAVVLIEHPAGGQYGQILVPAVADKDGAWGPVKGHTMFGGNLADTADSRWSRATIPDGSGRVCGTAIGIHDRVE